MLQQSRQQRPDFICGSATVGRKITLIGQHAIQDLIELLDGDPTIIIMSVVDRDTHGGSKVKLGEHLLQRHGVREGQFLSDFPLAHHQIPGCG